ncbi:MAG: TetR/AcrR family transcriptional regulator [Pseudomonadota bacterium]
MSRGSRTRARILDVAQEAVLAKGFEATSIDEIVYDAGITRSGFFYHFRDKRALAVEMIARYTKTAIEEIDEIIDRARELTDDPLQVLLITLKLIAEGIAESPNGHPGCVVATAAFHDRLVGVEIREANRRAVEDWRDQFRKLLDAVVAVYPPNDEIDLDSLADFMSGAVAGGIVMSRAHGRPIITAEYLLLVRSHVKLLFKPRYQ